MTRDDYIRDHLFGMTVYRMNVILILGPVVFLLLGLMDYFVTPANFSRFFVLRNGISLVLLLLFLLNRVRTQLQVGKTYLRTVTLIGTALSAATIEFMILSLGGHQSSYYAGLNLLALVVLSYVPCDLSFSVVLVSVIYAIYLVPILLLDKITNLPAFAAHNAFLIATFATVLFWRALDQRNLIKNLGLQYDLDKDKHQLETYSTQLERLVEERTRDLNKSEQMFRSLFDLANDGIMLMSRDGIILNANQRACEIHGFEQGALIGVNVELLETEEGKVLLRERMERIRRGESLLYETEHYRKDGTKVALEVSSKAIEIDGKTLIQSFHRDITEKKKLHEHLIQSQKMDSIGLLAGGIAHDFNNILTGILGYSELLLDDEDLSDRVREKVRGIEGSSLQAAAMVSKLLSFARRDGFDQVVFELGGLVRETQGILSRLIPKHVELKLELAASPLTMLGDATQIEQVLMNLILNARDAMPQGGEIVVKTDVVELGSGDTHIAADVARGKYIHLSVADTGSGIPEANLPHIFEPFYTTKEKGKGTGLGLAMVYGIVQGHHGYLTVQSVLNVGTRFDIYLPLSERRLVQAGEREQVVTEGGKTILVVDDEIPVLTFIKEALQNRGFNVIVSDNPLNALNIYRREHKKIDLVITDVIMPIMEGSHLIKSIRAINPRAGIIAMSGFSETLDEDCAQVMLRKPFTTVNLLMTIKNAMNPQAAGSN